MAKVENDCKVHLRALEPKNDTPKTLKNVLIGRNGNIRIKALVKELEPYELNLKKWKSEYIEKVKVGAYIQSFVIPTTLFTDKSKIIEKGLWSQTKGTNDINNKNRESIRQFELSTIKIPKFDEQIKAHFDACYKALYEDLIKHIKEMGEK